MRNVFLCAECFPAGAVEDYILLHINNVKEKIGALEASGAPFLII